MLILFLQRCTEQLQSFQLRQCNAIDCIALCITLQSIAMHSIALQCFVMQCLLHHVIGIASGVYIGIGNNIGFGVWHP